VTLRDRLLGLRDRLISNPDFQHWALTFPLTRPIVQYCSRKLFDLCAGFVYSQILLVCVKLKLFERLASGPLEVGELARQTGLADHRMLLVANAAISLGLLQRRSGRLIGLGPHGAALVGNPWIGRFIEHHDAFYRDLEDPLALLHGTPADTHLSRYWAYARAPDPKLLQSGEIINYTALMGVSQAAVARELLDAVNLSAHRILLDVGGGDGSFIVEAAKRHSHLRFLHADLPAVSAQAQANFAARGIVGHVVFVLADFLNDDLPEGADVVTLIRVAHDHDDAAVLKLFKAIRRVLPPDGRLVIAEAMSGMKGTAPVTDAYFNFYFAAMGSGRTRTATELDGLLRQAGFAGSKLVSQRNPLVASVLVATP
jgi:demethylspheroidene O-methyltransferase